MIEINVEGSSKSTLLILVKELCEEILAQLIDKLILCGFFKMFFD